MAEHVWVTSGGEAIPLKEMTHLHLQNAIAFMQRKVRKYEQEIDSCYGYVGGDMAEYYAAQAADEASEKLNRAHNTLCALLHERARRKRLSTVNDAIEVMQEANS